MYVLEKVQEIKMETKQKNKLPNLSGFTGTSQYHYLNFMKNLKFTDGFAYLANEANCFWLADIVASVQHKPKIRENNAFIIWRIVVNDDKALVDVHSDSDGYDDNGNNVYSDDKLLYKQKLNYTDFPEGTFEFYQCGDVVMLKGEY